MTTEYQISLRSVSIVQNTCRYADSWLCSYYLRSTRLYLQWGMQRTKQRIWNASVPGTGYICPHLLQVSTIFQDNFNRAWDVITTAGYTRAHRSDSRKLKVLRYKTLSNKFAGMRTESQLRTQPRTRRTGFWLHKPWTPNGTNCFIPRQHHAGNRLRKTFFLRNLSVFAVLVNRNVFRSLLRHTYGVLWRVPSPPHGLYPHRTTTQTHHGQTNTHALSGIQTRDPLYEISRPAV